MVNLETLRIMRENKKKNYDAIINSDYRFAVIDGIEIAYFSTREELHSAYPVLNPKNTYFGTPPLLVDIGKETNSREYQREQIEEERKQLHENAKINLIQGLDLTRREKILDSTETK